MKKAVLIEGTPSKPHVTATSAERAPGRRWHRLAVVLTVAAGAALWPAWIPADREPRRTGLPPTTVRSWGWGTSGGVAVGHEVLGEQQMRLSPERSRAWETGEGLHQVTVIAGTLRVDDDHGHRTEYRAGQSYLAGWSVYAVSNPTTEAVHLTVRYLRRAP